MQLKHYFHSLLLAGSLSLLTACGNANSTAEPPKKIEVTGSAEMEFVPDEIFMDFTLREYLGADRKKVDIDKIKQDFLAVCKNAGVPDSAISISGYAGYERWDYYWYRRRKTEPDFMASVTYQVQVNGPEKLDKIVSGLNDNALEGFSLSHTSHSKIEEFRKQVKTNALKAARAKAQYLAESVGESLGEALLIQEIEDSYYSDYASTRSNVSQIAMEHLHDENEATTGVSPDFQKMKLRYEMKAEFRLK